MLRTTEELNPEYISVGFIAKHCGVSNTTVLRWIEAGQLPAFRLPGGHHRIGREDLNKFLNKYHMPIGNEKSKNYL
ncbi:MAG: helix-turn-helix domain-containing protein [Dehalococcoidales bacterium]